MMGSEQQSMSVMGHRSPRGWFVKLDINPMVESLCSEEDFALLLARWMLFMMGRSNRVRVIR